MKRLVPIFLAVLMTMAITSQSFAYSLRWIGWYPDSASTYNYHIAVCLHTNVGGPVWDLTKPWEARFNDAIHEWNLGGELYYYRSDASCEQLTAWGHPWVQIGKSKNLETGLAGRTDRVELSPCAEHWGYICASHVAVWYADIEGMFYSGTGQTPSNLYNLEYTIAHELGHALGLNHSGCTIEHRWDLMYGDQDPSDSDTCGQTAGFQTSVSADDADGYVWYYGYSH